MSVFGPSPNQLNLGAQPGTQIATQTAPNGAMADVFNGSAIPLRNPAATGGVARPYLLSLSSSTVNLPVAKTTIQLENVGLGLGARLYFNGSIVLNLPAAASAGNESGFKVGYNFPFDIVEDASFQPSGSSVRVQGSGVLLREEELRMFGLRSPNVASSSSHLPTAVTGFGYFTSVSDSLGLFTNGLTPGQTYYNTSTTTADVVTIKFGFYLTLPWVDNFVDMNGLIPMAIQNAAFPINLNLNGVGNNGPIALVTEGTGTVGTVTSQSVTIDPEQISVSIPNNPALYTGLASNAVFRQTKTLQGGIGTGTDGVQVYFDQGFKYLACINDIRVNYAPISGTDIVDVALNFGPKTPVETRSYAQYVADYGDRYSLSPNAGIVLWDGQSTAFSPSDGDAFAVVNAEPGGIVRPHMRIGINSGTSLGPVGTNTCTSLLVSTVLL